MHIPDGLLDPRVCTGAAALSAGAVGLALRRVKVDFSERAVPLMGVSAACVFAAQMLNFPIPGGTSGHFLGGVLAAALLGPWAAILVLTVVLVVQCVLFQDGGLTALGANVLNIAVLGAGASYALYDLLRKRIGGLRGAVFGAVVASWFSVAAAAVLCSFEISVGGRYSLRPTLGAMLFFHSLIGVGEALITGFALTFVLRARPDLLHGSPAPTSPRALAGQILTAGLLLALLMAAVASPFASKAPDGLEAAMARQGFNEDESKPMIPAPFPDYKVAVFETVGFAGSAGGVVGVGAAFLAAWLLAKRLPRQPSRHHV